MVGRINDPNDEDRRVLTAVGKRLRDPDYRNNEDALSVTVLNELAVGRLRRLKEDIPA